MKTKLDSILNSRPTFDSPHIQLLFNVRGRTALSNSTLNGMATDDKKKKLEELRKSISNLESQKTLAKAEGNKRKEESILRMLKRFEKDIETLKKL